MTSPLLYKSLDERTHHRLVRLKTHDLLRQMTPPRGIDLSSNDYLNLSSDLRLKRAAMKAIEEVGIGATASRLLRGDREIFREAEQAFAAWKGTERSLFFNSGYQANIGLLTTFLEPGDLVLSDELNHASIIDGIRLTKARCEIYPHCNIDHIIELIEKTNCPGQRFLVTESLFSMDGTIAPLDKYAKICAKTNTNLIVDEAHAVGVFGRKGSGLVEEFRIEKNVFLSMNTAGKALGASGAFVAGSDWAIEYLINRARSFIFSTAPLPLIAGVLMTSMAIIQEEEKRRIKLRNLSAFFRHLLYDNGITVLMENGQEHSQIVPIMIGDCGKALTVAGALQADGFDVRAIRPPTVPENTARLRISLNAGLSEDILREFTNSLTEIIRDN